MAPLKRRYPDTGHLTLHGGRLYCLWYENHGSFVYDFARDAWDPLPAEPFQFTRVSPIAVSAGPELLVWGGAEKRWLTSREETYRGDGARLGPDGVWRPMADKKSPAARTTRAWAWTGDELVVWGGMGRKILGNGAVYRPASDTWRPVTSEGAPPPRFGCEAVWTGRELLVWGGADFDKSFRSGGFRIDGAAYDPAADRWRPIASLPGRPEDAGNSRTTAWFGDGALFVRRDATSGADVDTLSAWRYDVAADTFAPVSAPPEIRGAWDPKLLVCGRRLLLRFGEALLEYVVDRDVWVRHADLPAGSNARLLWTGEEVVAFETYFGTGARMRLPEALPEPMPARIPELAPAEELAEPTPPLLAFAAEAAVTAVACADGLVVAGHLDGTVRAWRRRAGDGPLVEDAPLAIRAADGRRVHGLAVAGDVLALVGDGLERRALDGELRETIAVSGYALAQRGDRVVVAGEQLVSLRREGDLWRVTAREAVPAERAVGSLALSDDGAEVALTLAPRFIGRGAKRQKLLDDVELRAADDLSVTLRMQASGVEPGTAAAAILEPTRGKKQPALLAIGGGGHYGLKLFRAGKKRPEDNHRTDTAWNGPMVTGGGAMLCRDAGDAATFSVARRDLLRLEVDDDEARTAGGRFPPPAFLTPDEVDGFVPFTRFGGTITALALDERGEVGALGTTMGATLVCDARRARVDRLGARGRADWPCLRGEVVLDRKPLAITADVERGAVDLVLDDGTYAELDVERGALTRGVALDRAELDALLGGLSPWESGLVRRNGDFLTVGHADVAVFSATTGRRLTGALPRHPQGKGVWTVAPHDEGGRKGKKKPRYALLKRDAISLEPTGEVELPAPPASATLEWLGGERWLVQLDTEGGPLAALTGSHFIVDAATGALTKLEDGEAAATLDGRHFAAPVGNGNAWRRWRIFGDDLATPLYTRQSPHRFTHVGVLPGSGRVFARISERIAFWDRDGVLRGPFDAHANPIRDVCPSRSGDFVATWDAYVVRRWDLRG